MYFIVHPPLHTMLRNLVTALQNHIKVSTFASPKIQYLVSMCIYSIVKCLITGKKNNVAKGKSY